jgi:hypothetical protein
MTRLLALLCGAVLFLVAAYRLPAPIVEVPESPTLESEQSARPTMGNKPPREVLGNHR